MSVDSPHTTVDKLGVEWAALAELAATFTEAQWKTPTECPGWTVQDNLSHIIGTERMLAGLGRTSHQAPEAPWVHNPIGRSNEDDVDERRARSGAEVYQEFLDITQARLSFLRSATPEDFAVPMTTPTGPGTMASFLHIRVMDNWIHEQDIRRALDLPGHLTGPVPEHSIDRLWTAWPMVIGKRAGATAGQSVTVTLDGPVHRFGTVVIGERAGWGELDASQTATAGITMDSEAFIIAVTGRRLAADLVETNRIRFVGDSALAQRAVDSLNIMI